MTIMMTKTGIKGDSATNGDIDDSLGIIRKHDPFPGTTATLRHHHQYQRNNNKCYKCRSEGVTMMFLASYLLIFTVVASFVTSQPVTNLPAGNNKLIKTPTQNAATTIPISTILSPPYSYPSSSASSSFYSDSNGNGNSTTASTTDVVTLKHSEKQGVKNQHHLSPVLPLSIPIVRNLTEAKKKEEELSNQFENENEERDEEDDSVPKTGAVASVNNPANHSPSPPQSHNNNGNDNVLSLTLTNTLRSGDTGSITSSLAGSASSLNHAGKLEMEKKKVELTGDKDKVMLTDDVRGSSSTVNPVSSSSSSSSFSSQNGNSLPPASSVAELRVKVNTITLEESMKTKGIPLEKHSKENHNSNLNLNKSQRFMSTAGGGGGQAVPSTPAAVVAAPTGKHEEMTVTTITTWKRKDDEDGTRNGDYYNGRDVDEERGTSGYANVVNNHVNSVEEQQMKEKQGVDTDYSNKTRASTATRVGEVVDDESQFNDKNNGATAFTASIMASSDSENGKSSPLSTSFADSSSTSLGNLMKSTRKSRPVTEMNSVSSPAPMRKVAADRMNNNKEERSALSATRENSKEEKKAEEEDDYNAHQQSHYYFYDYSDDSPTSSLTEEDDGNPPYPLLSSVSSSSSTSPLLMNKWIKTLVKLSQCRANCLDQAGIHHWDASLGQNDLQENHLGGDGATAATDNQDKGEVGATRAVTSSVPSSLQLLPLPTTTAATPNWSDLYTEEKPKTPVVYLEQMKEKKDERSNPPVRFPTTAATTPGRTIKVTPSKSMKYYELSNCQELCRRNYPIDDFSVTPHNVAVHADDHDDSFTNFAHDQANSQTGESKNEMKEDMVSNNSNNNIINGRNSNYPNSSSGPTASGNNSNGNNGRNNNNTDNNNNNENIEKKEKQETPAEGEKSSGVAADRKSNNNHHQQHHPQQLQQPKHDNLPALSSPTVEKNHASKAFGGGDEESGRRTGLSFGLPTKLLAIEQGFSGKEENNNNREEEVEHSSKIGTKTTTGSLNNLKTFPSEPGLRVRQLSLKKQENWKEERTGTDDDDGVASTFSHSSASQILQLSWPKPSRWERDDLGNSQNNKPEGASLAAAETQVKDKNGIRLDRENVGGATFEGNKKRENTQRPIISSTKKPITVVYSIILEESWDGKGSGDGSATDGTRDMYYARRWKLIDQIVARTTTQISLPLLPIVEEEKVQSEQKKNEEGENNKMEKMSLTEQKVRRISSGSGEPAALLNERKEEIIKLNENKRKSEKGMMILKPLPPPSHSYEEHHQQKSKPFFRSTDPPSKVTLRVLAVSREGLEKVYSAQVKVNNSFWDYHLNEHHPDHQQVYREKENLNQNEQADDSKTWTYAASASDSHHNKAISSSPATTKFLDGNDDVGEKAGSLQKNGSDQIEKVGKLEKEKKKVEEKGKGGDEDAAVNFNESNENSNQILVFPSEESLRQTLGRGLSGEMKVKKLMSLLKQKKKKSENEVDNDNHLPSNTFILPLSTSVSTSSGKEEVSYGKPEANFPSKEADHYESNNISNEVKIPSQTINLKDEQAGKETTQNWGLHTVSMIYQKFLVVTQVTWDYPGEEENDEEGNFSNNATNANTNKTDATALNKTTGTAKKIPSSPSKKWKGCGSRASNSNNTGATGVDTGKEQQLNFLLSWEIFGGGLRGNLVTDTCSASISLWPDTTYIIQVGLITPNKMDSSTGEIGMTKTNGLDSLSYTSYLTAWQSPHTSKASQSNNNNRNILSNHVPYISNYVEESTEHAGRDGDYKPLEKSSDNLQSVPSSSSSQAPSSFDPLILPESITFPFDGEPKVTIKSERILVNTTRAGKSGLEENDADDDRLGTTIHNQDKVTLGNSQSNNNFLALEKEESTAKRNKWMEEDNDEQVVSIKKNFGSNGSSNDSRLVSGINDKVNVSPITITRNGHSENGPGPAFEEEMVLLQEANDQPESEALPLPLSSYYRHDKVEQTVAAGVNEDTDAATDQENSSVWSDEDEDEATDQDESLFARSLAHQNHQQHHHPRKTDKNSIPPAHHFRAVSLPQPHIQTAGEVEAQQKQENIPPKSLNSKFHSFMTVNSFYQSLYALSRNALELSHRYPNVIKITNPNEGNNGGSNKHGNGSSSASTLIADSNIGPLVIGEFGSSNRTGYLFSTSHSGDDDDASGIKGKLYTLFVVLVISFVIFLFIVAIVGFCVLTSSIKENYKYFVPKKVRVWTTVGQLIKGSSNNQAGGSSSSSNGGGGGLFKDSAEGSFYPRRLQEEPDYDEDNDDFDPDEDDDEEEVTSVAETDDEDDVDSECECRCVTDNEIVEVEEEENSFSLNERCSSDTVQLIRDGEENSVELMAAIDEESEDNGEVESNSCGVEGEESNSSSINNSNRCGGSHHYHHHHHRGNCDNNNPCYHTTPSAASARIFQSASAAPPTVKASPVAAAFSSLKKNFHRVSSSASSKQYQHQRHNNHHHPHCHHYHQHHKRKSDTRIDVTGSNSRNSRNLLNPRQDGYY